MLLLFQFYILCIPYFFIIYVYYYYAYYYYYFNLHVMFFYIYVSFIIMFYVVPFIIYYYYFSFHVSYVYICIFQNEDKKDNKKNIFIFIYLYFLYVGIKIHESKFYQMTLFLLFMRICIFVNCVIHRIPATWRTSYLLSGAVFSPRDTRPDE